MGHTASELSVQMINDHKRACLDTLLETDSSAVLTDHVLSQAALYVLKKADTAVCAAVVTMVSDRAAELKYIFTKESYRNQGYAARLIYYLFRQYRPSASAMFAGATRDDLDFYRKIGFEEGGVVGRFFVENYADPTVNQGRQCANLIYLKYDL